MKTRYEYTIFIFESQHEVIIDFYAVTKNSVQLLMEIQFQFQLFCFRFGFILVVTEWKELPLLNWFTNPLWSINFREQFFPDPFSDSPKIARFPKISSRSKNFDSWKILWKIQHFWTIWICVRFKKTHKQFGRMFWRSNLC